VLLETAFGGSRLIDMLAGDYPKPSLTSMSLDGLDNDGAAGEGDYFRGDIEHLQGGQANDILTGNDQANGFAGEDGDDQITGLGGDDVLAGGPGRDMITGGAGRDSLYLADGERDTATAAPTPARRASTRTGSTPRPLQADRQRCWTAH
jgi:hypothetical protein